MKKYLFAIALLAQILNMQAQDWPQFMGPNRNGITTQEGLLRTWPEGGPQTLWSVNLGIGCGMDARAVRAHPRRQGVRHLRGALPEPSAECDLRGGPRSSQRDLI